VQAHIADQRVSVACPKEKKPKRK